MNRPGRILPGALTSCAAVALIFSRCSFGPLSGGGTEGGNVVCGIFVNDDGSTSAKVTVHLIPSDYNPGAADRSNPVVTSITAGDGGYSFNHVPRGSYSVEAIDTVKGKRSLVTGVDVSGEDIRIPVDTLRNPGAIRILLPATADAATGYVYVRGTTMYARFAGDTGYAVVSAPSATPLPPICYATLSDPTPVILRYDVQVASGDTTVVTHPGWKYARLLCLNTTATGAGVAGDVTGFPILVRLTKDNFDFTQADAEGGDIRFARSDTVALPYEIEQWDAAARRAEVWVRVDTIYGNNGTQTITMYWGNDAAGDVSDGRVVFDTSEGFAGVWHLGDSSIVMDATINGYTGTRNGNQRRIEGLIGFGQYFDGNGDFTDMGDVCNLDTSGLTLCAWIKPAVTGKRITIISKSNGGTPSSDYGWLCTLDDIGALQFFAATATGAWGEPNTFIFASNEFIEDTTTWHHVAVVVDRTGNENCFLYLDGENVTTFPAGSDMSEFGPIVNTISLRLGSSGGTQWNGSMDECSLSFRARSADWIRLCYMNQQADDLLVEFQ